MRAGQARLRRYRRAPVARHPRAQGPGRGTLSPDHAAAPQARDAVFAGTRHTPPPKTSTFPRDKAEKSPSQQRDFSIPHSWSQPTKTPTFPHQRTEKSPLQQHVVSYNPVDGGLVLRPVAGWCCGLSRVPAGVGWQSLLVCGLSAPALPAPVQQGPVSDAFPAFIGAPPGSPAPVRERDASEGA